MDVRKGCADAIEEILSGGAYKATVYLSNKLTVKATRKRYKGKFLKKTIDITLTIGPPNYEEREKIKQAKKLGVILDIQTKVPKQ